MDLSTNYMGLHLKHPVVASASPISYTLDGIRDLEAGGASAIVLYSLFEEQIEQESQRLDHYLNLGTNTYPEALDYFPEAQSYNVGPEKYLDLIRAAKSEVDVPIIASLNGVSTGGWTGYARRMQDAGADALELNIYYINTDPHKTSAEVEELVIDIVREVKSTVTIPVAVKLSPYFSSFANVSMRIAHAGANALVIFNRFYQPDIDLEALEVTPNLQLSNSSELRLPLRWAAILHGKVPIDLALTSGIHTHRDVLKGIMAGATVTMMTSALLQLGAGRINEVVTALNAWGDEHEYVSVSEMRGSMSQANISEPNAYVRANYMKMLSSWQPDPTGVKLR